MVRRWATRTPWLKWLPVLAAAYLIGCQPPPPPCGPGAVSSGGTESERGVGGTGSASASVGGERPLGLVLESTLPPGFDTSFILPTSRRDQYGNPVVKRKGQQADAAASDCVHVNVLP